MRSLLPHQLPVLITTYLLALRARQLVALPRLPAAHALDGLRIPQAGAVATNLVQVARHGTVAVWKETDLLRLEPILQLQRASLQLTHGLLALLHKHLEEPDRIDVAQARGVLDRQLLPAGGPRRALVAGGGRRRRGVAKDVLATHPGSRVASKKILINY